MKMIHTAHVAKDVIKVLDPVILEETGTTRRCFHGSLVGDLNGQWTIRGCITHQRRAPGGTWIEEDSEKLSKLKAGEIKKIDLSRDQIRKLITGLNALAQAAEMKGAGLDISDIVVAVRNRVVEIETERKAVIEQLIAKDYGSEFWESLRTLRPDVTAQFADAELFLRRRTAVAQFEAELVKGQWAERDWELFFNANLWIFGLGLRFHFLNLLQSQANYGGSDRARQGEQKGEFLMNTEGDVRFTVLVEIKRPNTRFFASGSAYRNGVPGFHPDFTNAISQVQVNASTWETEGSKREQDAESLAEANIRTISPRTILVCGHLRELDTPEKRKSFELFRCKLTAPEIVTFDELLARAQFITRDTISGAAETPKINARG